MVQYGPDLLQCFNRFTGETMPHDQLAELMKPPEEFLGGQVEQRVVLQDAAGRPLSGVQGPVVLAKPGAAMLDLVSKGASREV